MSIILEDKIFKQIKYSRSLNVLFINSTINNFKI
jgi:hypothetical protein